VELPNTLLNAPVLKNPPLTVSASIVLLFSTALVGRLPRWWALSACCRVHDAEDALGLHTSRAERVACAANYETRQTRAPYAPTTDSTATDGRDITIAHAVAGAERLLSC
jgi:hypothetical protein